MGFFYVAYLRKYFQSEFSWDFVKRKKIVLEMKIPWFVRKMFSWKTNFKDTRVRTLILKTTWKFDLKSSGREAFLNDFR